MECMLKFYEDKEFYQLGFQVVDLKNTGKRATLSRSISYDTGMGLCLCPVHMWIFDGVT